MTQKIILIFLGFFVLLFPSYIFAVQEVNETNIEEEMQSEPAISAEALAQEKAEEHWGAENPFVQMGAHEQEHLERLQADLEAAQSDEERKMFQGMIEHTESRIEELEAEAQAEEERQLESGEDVAPVVSIAFTGSGSGTEEDPYEISTCAELQEMKNDLLAYYELVNDVDCSDTVNWNGGAGFDPVGYYPNYFQGSLNGNEYVIDQLFIDRPTEDDVGLFGYTESSVISNIGLTNVQISGYLLVGGLVGFNNSSSPITNSYAAGNVSGKGYIGGLVGWNSSSSIANSYATGSVSGDSGLGGLVGINRDFSSIANSYATGNVSGNGYIGGLVGNNSHSSSIANSYATGNVSGSYYVGGLVGWNSSSSIANSYATGNVSEVSLGGGGLVGTNDDSSITNSYATGNVSGGSYVGGVVGSNNDSSSVADSYATGNVSGNNYVGGLVGSNNDSSSVADSYATGIVSGYSLVGGLVGVNKYSTIAHSYATGSVSGDGDLGGLVGSNKYSSITNSYATGSVSGNVGGGLTGYNYSSAITNSYATGNVSGVTSGGGLVGTNDDSSITNSYATGTVSGNDYVGGLVGSNKDSSTITHSYATGNVSGDGLLGGLVGLNDYNSSVTDSYWDIETSGQTTSSGGEGKTTAEMMQQATFVDWDFTDIWRIDEGKDYPRLTPSIFIITPSSYDFGDVPIFSFEYIPFVIRNAGDSNLVLQNIVLSQLGTTFSFLADYCSGKTLTAQQECVINLAVFGTTTGAKTATIDITSNDTVNTPVVPPGVKKLTRVQDSPGANVGVRLLQGISPPT